jgi:glycosyltransferase involved in cell wall biosynthesis
MRIALCTETLYPVYGVEKRCVEMARRLPEHGYDVTVYTSTPAGYFPGLEINQVSKPTIVRPPKRNYATCINYWYSLFRNLLKDKYDIIDANGHLSLLPCSLAGMLKGKPVVATIHDLYLSDWGTMGFGFTGLPFELASAKTRFRRIITLNSSLKSKMVEILKMRKDRIEIIPSGIDVDYINKIKPSKKNKTVLYAGRLVPQKKVDILLKAFALSGVDAELKIIGEGKEYKRLVNLSKSLGIRDKVQFTGQLKRHEDVIKEMKKASLFVLPSRRECFGITILEAMCSGTAVVSTATEGPRDIIKNGVNGFLTEIGDEQELSEKIKTVIQNKSKRKKIEINAKKTAKSYDWDHIVRRIARIYENVYN